MSRSNPSPPRFTQALLDAGLDDGQQRLLICLGFGAGLLEPALNAFAITFTGRIPNP